MVLDTKSAENKALTTSDHFIIREGQAYSGAHLLIDLWGASSLTDMAFIEATLKECVTVCKARLLHIHLHQFSDSGGVSGVAVLAESHISLHTWPERDYAAFDVFMCGATEPMLAVDVLKRAFQPEKIEVKEILRGGAGDI
ncbi:S-adenosylmethionine decarboxylase proenzyme, prokaryotic class 1B [hydrothermal vent metagenome]|uniref:S-adenosylmethionine decarboxylase proenzyme, prokaryotic class 1B n=1 Tax=hydrothermal vent metagenome TaxID=652676 RepID=A0A3B0XVT1_9ZZZZ